MSAHHPVTTPQQHAKDAEFSSFSKANMFWSSNEAKKGSISLFKTSLGGRTARVKGRQSV
jgi:hypothetical protein